MAESKRNSTSGKVATPMIGGQGINELDAALSKALGARIRLTTTLPGHVLEGTLFTTCSITNLVAVNTAPAPPNPSSTLANQPGDYHIIPVSHIQSFQLLSLPAASDRVAGSGPGFEGALPSITKVDLDSLKAKEEQAIRKIKERDATRGRGVGKDAQEVFDHINRTLPASWQGTDISVSGVTITKPYRVEDCSAAPDRQVALNQIKKVLDGFYRKKSAQGGNRPGVATPIAPRKGG